MILLHLIGRQCQGGKNTAQEQPGSVRPADQIAVLALPTQPGGLGNGFFHHGGGIHEDLQFAAAIGLQPACQGLQALFDYNVVILPDLERIAIGQLSG